MPRLLSVVHLAVDRFLKGWVTYEYAQITVVDNFFFSKLLVLASASLLVRMQRDSE
jgi:hypothetical protein